MIINEKTKLSFTGQAGPAFLIGNLSYTGRVSLTRVDNGQNFTAVTQSAAGQKLFIPYLRAQIGVDYSHKLSNKLNIGVAPFLSLGLFNSDKIDFSTIPNDPTFKSTGAYKKNRNEYGIKLFFEF